MFFLVRLARRFSARWAWRALAEESLEALARTSALRSGPEANISAKMMMPSLSEVGFMVILRARGRLPSCSGTTEASACRSAHYEAEIGQFTKDSVGPIASQVI